MNEGRPGRLVSAFITARPRDLIQADHFFNTPTTPCAVSWKERELKEGLLTSAWTIGRSSYGEDARAVWYVWSDRRNLGWTKRLPGRCRTRAGRASATEAQMQPGEAPSGLRVAKEGAEESTKSSSSSGLEGLAGC